MKIINLINKKEKLIRVVELIWDRGLYIIHYTLYIIYYTEEGVLKQPNDSVFRYFALYINTCALQ
jgi:hypothetical protein